MYALFYDKSALDSQSLTSYISEWKITKNIAGEDFKIHNVDEITTLCREYGQKYTTVIAVGTDRTFDTLVGQSKHLNPDVVFGYIPSNLNILARRIGVKDYKEACDVIAQRKIIELTALSCGQNYFLFQLEINVEQNESKNQRKVLIQIDDSIEISLSTDNIVLHNRNQELLPHNTAILLEAFSKPLNSSGDGNLLKIASSRLKKSGSSNSQLQLRVPGDKIRIESSTPLSDAHAGLIKQSIRVGFSKKAIRLIVKKGQELQAIMSPGLIS